MKTGVNQQGAELGPHKWIASQVPLIVVKFERVSLHCCRAGFDIEGGVEYLVTHDLAIRFQHSMGFDQDIDGLRNVFQQPADEDSVDTMCFETAVLGVDLQEFNPSGLDVGC